MSHSVVKDIPPATDNTLVIVVGQDGSLSVDNETLDNLVSLDSETKVSVVRVNDDDGSTVNMTLDTYQNTETAHQIKSQVLGELTVNVDEVQRNYNNFLMDHCYTPLTSPSQKHPVPVEVDDLPPEDLEIDDLAHTLSILDGSEKPLVHIITNKQQPQTKFTKTLVHKEPKTVQSENIIKQTLINKVNKTGVNKIYKNVKTVLTKTPNSKKVFKNDDAEFTPEEEVDDEPYEDSDFELNDSLNKKGNKRTYKRRPKIESGEELTKEKPKPTRKSAKNPLKTPPKPVEKIEAEKIHQEPKVVEPTPVVDHGKLQISPDHKKSNKKDKKTHPKPPIDDGIALFSTPDIIRRVGKDKHHESLHETQKIPKPARIEDRSRSESSRTSQDSKTKAPQRLSLDSKLPEKFKLIKDRRNSDKKVETISAIKNALMMSENLVNSTQNPQNLYMTNQIEPVVPTVDELNAIIHPPNSQIQPGQNINENQLNMESNPVLDAIDHAILANINPDELMSEDILDQVAKLVENPDLQNAIDTTLVEGNLNLDPALQQQINQSVQGGIGSVQPVIQPGTGLPVQQNIPQQQLLHQQQQAHQQAQQPQQPSQAVQPQRQIVRSDGRVVVLPPIEKPATRSSKRKQVEPSVEIPAVVHEESSEQIQISQSNQHATNSKHHTATVQNKDVPPIPMDVAASEESDSDESWNSEDDPDRLWCICKQPHNNRFMICCDTCEDWFHGKCVNVTKAMGQQMEQQGKEWMCPNCIKKQNEGQKSRRSSDASNTSTKKAEKVESNRRKSSDSSSSVPACIVCGAPSRASSVYCSDACILKHAQGVERDQGKQNVKSPAQRITVYERATGKTVSGPNAPTAANLKQWLKEHPGYEVVRPENKNMAQSKLQLVKNASGKGVSLAVSKKGVQVGVLSHSPKAGSQIKLIPATKLNTPTSQKTPSKSSSQNQTPPAKPKLVQTTLKSPPHSASTPTKSNVNKTPTSKNEKSTPKTTPGKKSDTPIVDKVKAVENVRENVRKTLQEQLSTRLKEVDDLKLTEDEMKKLAHDIEYELYKLFGDAGPKYRTKYRSLIFNIKDIKNQTLWRRICDKSTAPAQLVRLSPDDLASQELARWREQENKHQLDMIKKSELEMLQINRTYVLKTHKGEQVMEDKIKTVNEEDVLPGLTADSTSEDVTLPSEKSESSDHSSERHSKSSSSKHNRRDRDRKSSRDRRSHSKERRKDLHRHSRDKKKRSRSKDRDKSKSRDRSSHRSDRKRSRSRDRHHRSSHKSSRHKRDKHAIDYLDKKSKEILDNLESNKIVPPEDRLWKHVPQQDISVSPDSDSDHEPTSTVTIPTPPRSIEPEDTHTHNNHHHSSHDKDEKHHHKTTSEHKTEKPLSPEPEKSLSPPPKAIEELREPTTPTMEPKITSLSKETIIWEGNINMIDVAKFFITMHEVSGDCLSLGPELPTTLEIVGRISPDTVWEYISKMKKSNSKVICVIRLTAANVEEKMPYIALYSYLSSRNRLGVIKTISNAVKDFYILPLASHAPVPQTLLPLSGPGFEESRPHLLLGIIVRTKRKRLSTSDIISAPVVKRSKLDSPPLPTIPSAPPRSYTPPPTRDPRIKLPTVPAVPEPPPVTNDEDEPYSPEDSDPDNSLPLPEIKKPTKPDLSALTTSNSNSGTLNAADISSMLAGSLKANTFLDGSAGALPSFEPFTKQFEGIPGLDVDNGNVDSLQRKMEELDKCIEKQKEEIRSISQNIVSSGTATNMATNLSNISLPSNLQQILDSIKNIPEQASSAKDEYTPTTLGYKATSEELTIPLLLPSRTRSQKPSAPIIPLQLPLNPRESTPIDCLSQAAVLPNLGIPSPLSSTTIPLNLPKTRSKTTPGNSPVVSSQSELNKDSNKGSVLSSLSEEELIRKANEMLGETEPEPEARDDTPEPDNNDEDSTKYSPSDLKTSSAPIYNPTKRPKVDHSQPPIPGLEDDFK